MTTEIRQEIGQLWSRIRNLERRAEGFITSAGGWVGPLLMLGGRLRYGGLSSFPASPSEGDTCYREDLDTLYLYTDSWIALGGGSGSPPASHADTHLPGGSDPLTVATPVEITDTTNAAGSAESFVRSDHQHAHGNRGGGSLHALVTTSVAGFMSAADKLKLDGISDGAVADHGALTGLTDDDHTQYMLVDGTRAWSAYQDIPEIAPPGTPATNHIRLYNEEISGFSFLSFKDDTGMVRKLARDSVFLGYNNTGSSIPAFRAVYATGSTNGTPTIDRARSNSVATMPSIGVTLEAIANGAYGRVMQVGLVENVDTSAFTPGDVLYVSSTVAGVLVATAPLYPNIRQEIGTILSSSVTGSVQVVARSMFNEGVLDHGGLLGLADDDHTQYLLASGTRALTGNWDAGDYQIRAQTLYADVATGTAPLTVVSTTLVTNLNSDMLDGYHAADLIGGLAPIAAQYVVMALDASLTQERVLTAGTGISITDGGAGGNVTVAAADVPLADLAGYARGRIIRGGTADWEALALGTVGTVLRSDGTDAAWANPATTVPVAPSAQNQMLLANATPAWVLLAAPTAQYQRLSTETSPFTPSWTTDLPMADDAYIGFPSSGGRIIFDSTPTPDEMIVRYANLVMRRDDGTDILWIRRSGAVSTTEADIYANENLGLAADVGVHAFIDADNNSTTSFFGVHKDAEDLASATELMRITEAPLLFLNETLNAKMTVGMTINQGANDDEALAVMSSGVAHGGTDYADTNTWFNAQKSEGDSGGAAVSGFKDGDGVAGLAMIVRGFLAQNVQTTKSSAGRAIVEVHGFELSGTSWTDTVADGNVFGIRTRRGGSNVTLLLLDEDGEIHTDDVIGDGNDWDDWDDLTLAADLSRLPQAKWDEMMRYKAKDFERAGLLTLSVGEDGRRHAFIKHKAMLQLYACCFREVAQRMQRYEQALIGLGVDPARLAAKC